MKQLLFFTFFFIFVGCGSAVDFLGLSEKHKKKINRKYSKYTTVEIIDNNKCTPQYEVTNTYPFSLNLAATCECSELNKPYKYSRETIEPSGRRHYMPKDKYRFNVLNNNIIGAANGIFQGTKSHLSLYINDKTLDEKGIYTVIETIEMEDCHYTMKFSFYFDPSVITY